MRFLTQVRIEEVGNTEDTFGSECVLILVTELWRHAKTVAETAESVPAFVLCSRTHAAQNENRVFAPHDRTLGRSRRRSCRR